MPLVTPASGWPSGIFGTALAVWLGLALASFVALFFVPAPYGRYAPRTAGRWSLPARLGWVAMEAPAALTMPVLFWLGSQHGIVEWTFLLLWLSHYLDRALLFPLRLREGGRRTPLAIVVLAMLFNVANGFFNGRWLFALAGGYPESWLRDPRWLAGVALFAGGWWINRWADGVLRRLRAPGESGYRIPRGGLFELVSCPNYLGEILIWCGWALATWSLAGLAFALWTVANLAPRARSHHAWYRARFADYPPARRALIPLLL